MTMFVHLNSAANAPRIRRSGIRAAGGGRGGARGVYCFPVLASYTLTHQWLRELSRFGTRGGLAAVHIRLDDDQPVLVGHYADRARGVEAAVTAAEAVHRVATLADPRGWEVFVPRAIHPREVHRTRAAPQVTGWRYRPDAHGTRPCTGFGCRVRGEYGSRRLRERMPHPLDGPAPPQPAAVTNATLTATAGVLALIGTNGPMTVLRVTDPRTWSASDRVADIVPHVAYALVATAVLKGLSPGLRSGSAAARGPQGWCEAVRLRLTP